MPYLSRLLLASAGLLLTTSAALAQRREVADVVFVPEAQVELALKGNDYLLATFGLTVSGEDNAFGTRQLRLGYEHFWSKQWSYGATLRLPGGDYDGYGDLIGLAGNVVPGVLLRHTSQLGGLTFGQRLGLEYALTTGNLSPYRARALGRLRLDLERQLPLSGKVTLRPRLAYEAAAYLRFQRDEGQTKERVIDFGNLRAEAGLRLSPHFDLTPWVAAQSAYYNSLPQYDSNGNQTSGGRTNNVTPVVGLDLRFTLLPKRRVGTERQQLPTQH